MDEHQNLIRTRTFSSDSSVEVARGVGVTGWVTVGPRVSSSTIDLRSRPTPPGRWMDETHGFSTKNGRPAKAHRVSLWGIWGFHTQQELDSPRLRKSG